MNDYTSLEFYAKELVLLTLAVKVIGLLGATRGEVRQILNTDLTSHVR